MDKHTDRQESRQSDRQTDRQPDKKVGWGQEGEIGWKEDRKPTDRQEAIQSDGQKVLVRESQGRQVGRNTENGQTGWRIDTQTDGQRGGVWNCQHCIRWYTY